MILFPGWRESRDKSVCWRWGLEKGAGNIFGGGLSRLLVETSTSVETTYAHPQG